MQANLEEGHHLEWHTFLHRELKQPPPQKKLVVNELPHVQLLQLGLQCSKCLLYNLIKKFFM